jgi:hypothetical protein
LEAGTGHEESRRLNGFARARREPAVKRGSAWVAPLLIGAVVLLLRLPFLNQAIQGDDVYYLFGAEHALIDPAHPSHAKYIFQGELVDMRGHPHPPLNSLILAGLIAAQGDVNEIFFHLVYIVFSVTAAASMWSLARRFSAYPLGATLLFLAVPAFVINGNSLESDIPFLAFWMAGFALFVSGRLWLSGAALALAAMTAYQAVVATPILMFYCWLHRRQSRAAWIATLTPVITVAVYQIYERVTSGALPAAVLTEYFESYGLQQITKKLENAAALTAHAGWLVFPLAALYAFRSRWPVAVVAGAAGFFIDPHPLYWVSFAAGALVIGWCIRKPDFLTAWVVIFFASALVLFFAGSARYLLPMAAPVVMLAARERRVVIPAVVLNLVLGLCLSVVNYQHWNGYREFARSIQREIGERRVWINGEWGMRYYLESEGALPFARTQVVQPGEWVVSSALGYPQAITAPVALVTEREIRPSLPLRLVGLNSESGYSAASFGFRPFDIATGVVDRIRAEVVLERKPVLSYLPMNAVEAQNQIVSGVYQAEGEWRWMSGRAVVLLKPEQRPLPLHVKLFVPDQAPAREIRIQLDGELIHEQRLPGPGVHEVTTAAVKGSTVSIVLDKTFSVPGDYRQLGAILVEVGFR